MLIVASVGINSLEEDKIRKMVLAGADIIRFNFSYRNMEENSKTIQRGQKIIDEMNASTKILFDYPLKKIRLGDFDIKHFAVRENEEFIMQSGSYTTDCNQFIPVQMTKLGEKTRLNQIITIGDGEVALNVTGIIDSDTIKVRIMNNGIIYFRKEFNMGYCKDKNSLLDEYKTINEQTNFLEPDYVAIPYIEEGFNEELKKIFFQKNYKPELIIKIEHKISDENLVKICNDKDYKMLLIDRGEIGVNLPFEKVGLWQKKICAIARQYKKMIMVSTQILESTMNYYIPHRSEILDLTNMILDGVNGIMLCHETSYGLRPAYSISVAKKIISEVENQTYENNKNKNQNHP